MNVKAVKNEFHIPRNMSKPSIIHIILLNRTFRILLALGIFCMLVPLLDYLYFYYTDVAEFKIDDSGICSHPYSYQIPCGNDENITELECKASACCFSSNTGCYHFLPSKYQLKLKSERPWSIDEVFVPTKEVSPLKTVMYESMKLDIVEESDEVLSIMLWNPSLMSYNVTKSLKSFKNNSNYSWKVFSPELFIEVKRKINNETIFSTTRGALIVSENYFEWSVFLGSNDLQLMGFDTTDLKEGHRILINNVHSSVIPYVVAYDTKTKHYHGLHFESIDSPTEIQILKSNTIIIKQYYSASFRMKLFTGPAYADVYKQIKSFVKKSYYPDDFWSFGVHYCHTNLQYNEASTKIELSQLLINSKIIPFDSHCIDSELTALLMSQNNTDIISNIYRDEIEELKQKNKKILIHMSLNAIEVITNDETEQQQRHEAFKSDELFLKDVDGTTNFIGLYGENKKVLYLDYITKSSKIAEILMSQKQQHQFDVFKLSNGIFLFKNFPFYNTVNKKPPSIDDFTFKPKNFETEIENLIPLNVKLENGEPLIHQLNNYGREQIEVFQQTLNDDGKKFCIADSYRETSNEWCGMLMRVKKASWTNFQSTINKSVFYSLIGMSFYGAEVCGSGGWGHGSNIDDDNNNIDNIAEELCIRWYQFATFMPLFYVNSDRVPTKFTKYAQRIMVLAIRTRYALLNYMRTCMLMEIPLLRPLRYVYPEILIDDDNADEIELISNHQLMFGDSLMIAPVMEPLTVQVNLYFPEKYYEMWSGLEMPQNSTHFSIVMHDIPIFIRAGHIIALNLAHESVSAQEARLQPYLLIVALSCTENFTCYARGKQSIVDGVELKFEASETHLNITVITDENPSERRNEICGPEPFASSEFRFAKIYGLGDFKEMYRNDYLSLDLNICDADWKEIFSISI
ncbi:unnamed protein product [Chironomus riparius]|uniref:Alpha-glucosidase n=1 Tax=Chironomus riparius TaxID=315576 RepID=A0A9N9S1Z0_9DIPT|nr:unnamed protein product [Chironomus riparius]